MLEHDEERRDRRIRRVRKILIDQKGFTAEGTGDTETSVRHGPRDFSADSASSALSGLSS